MVPTPTCCLEVSPLTVGSRDTGWATTASVGCRVILCHSTDWRPFSVSPPHAASMNTQARLALLGLPRSHFYACNQLSDLDRDPCYRPRELRFRARRRQVPPNLYEATFSNPASSLEPCPATRPHTRALTPLLTAESRSRSPRAHSSRHWVHRGQAGHLAAWTGRPWLPLK